MHVPASQNLWRHKDFLKFWIGETISEFGSQITAFALPLTAVLLLGATPVQMGILSFLAFAPMLFLTLFAGVLVDRLPRRPILIFTSLGQAIILGTVPLAALYGLLHIAYLYIVVLCCGVLTVFFEVAYQAYLPSLIEQAQMVEGNGKMEMSHALAQIAGSGLAGSIVQFLTAPLAIVLDAFSFLVSAAFLCCIHKAEPAKVHRGTQSHIFKEIRAGLQIVLRNRILWSIAACNATMNLFSSANASIVSALPLGSLLGGLLGTAIGLRLAILIGALGMSLAFLWVLFSSLTHMREQPAESASHE